jgi:hypothetical protein
LVHEIVELIECGDSVMPRHNVTPGSDQGSLWLLAVANAAEAIAISSHCPTKRQRLTRSERSP